MTEKDLKRLKEINKELDDLTKKGEHYADIAVKTKLIHDEIKTGMGVWKLVDKGVLAVNGRAVKVSCQLVKQSVSLFKEAFSIGCR